MKTCRTCRHWGEHDETVGYPVSETSVGARICSAIVTKESIVQTAAAAAPIGVESNDIATRTGFLARSLHDAVCYIDDSREDVSVLVTTPDFGCLKHSPATAQVE